MGLLGFNARLILGAVVLAVVVGVSMVIAEFRRKAREAAGRKQADEVMGKSGTRYRRLFESTQDGVLLLDADTGQILDVNPFLLNMLGYSHRDFLGKKLWEIGPFADVAASRIQFSELQTKEYVRYENLPLETKDGRLVDVEFVSNVYLVDREKIIQCNVRDITLRKEIEAGLEKTRKELAAIKISADEAGEYAESIINTVREPLIVLDQDLRVVKVSRSFYDFFKVKPEETMGQLIYDLGNKQWDIPKLRELLETILPQKTSFDNYEVEHVFATIGRRTMLLNARQIERVLGMDRIILLAIEDITDRKRAEERLHEAMRVLERANHESREFVNVASHDLKEPLRKVLSFADRLKEHLGPILDEQGADYLKRMITAAERMNLLIEDILKFSRITTTAKPFESVDLGALLLETLGDLEVSIEEAEAVITADALPVINADRLQMGQVLQNLIGNSIKYRRKNVPCNIAIRAALNHAEREMHGARYAAGKLLSISVEDNGIGFDEKHVKRIFGVFQRLHDKMEYDGTGVGLAICKKIVERHNGEIEVKSELDRGSRFTVVLPVSSAALLYKTQLSAGIK